MSIPSLSVNRTVFLRRFLATSVTQSAGQVSVDIPPEASRPEDRVSLSPQTPASKDIALQTAQQIDRLSQVGLQGTLPIVVSAAILKSMWSDEQAPTSPQERPPDLIPKASAARAIERQSRVLDRLNSVSSNHSAEFILNDAVGPASASGNKVWMNPLLASKAFASEDLLAMVLAHEKGHIMNGDTNWEPSATGVLWETMVSAYEQAVAQGDSASSKLLDRGIRNLEKSFASNAQVNEVDADLKALEIIERAGYDRKPGLAFLLRTSGDAHHLPGPKRIEVLRQRLQGTAQAISDQEMAQIIDLSQGSP